MSNIFYLQVISDYHFYFMDSQSGYHYHCLGIDVKHKKIITLEATFIHEHDIIFDFKKQKIEFVAADCNKETKDIIKKNKENENNREDNIYNTIKGQKNIKMKIYNIFIIKKLKFYFIYH